MDCILCSEPIDRFDVETGAVEMFDGEAWHIECAHEYAEED